MAQENARLAIGLLETDSQASPPISEATADLLRQVCLSQLRRAAIAQREVRRMARSKFWRLGLAYWSWRKKLVGATWPLRHLIQWLQRNNA